ncbi:MAG TPA: nucleotidyltransferase family protein [Candidatus Binataceae bacterium]|nr:nucleotidyltransferase family protein [Candidatus Binataceae bacterium]
MSSLRIEAIVLAAGESRRMGFPKPLLRVGDETFIARTLRMMLPAVARAVIVLGAHAERIRAAIPADPRIAIVENPDYANGQLSSLKIGLGALAPEASAAMVHLADHPMVAATTFLAVAEAYRRTRGPIVIARHAGRRGHPAIFDRSIFPELLAASLAQGARAVVNAIPARIVYSDVDDPGVALDLDTPEDLARAGLPPAPR